MMTKRGISVAHTTIMRWTQRYVAEFDKRWNRFAHGSILARRRNLRQDQGPLDLSLPRGRQRGENKRDVAAAKAFFRQAIKRQGRLPNKITLDGYQVAGNELMHRIRKGQFKLGKLRIKDKSASEIWNAVLAA